MPVTNEQVAGRAFLAPLYAVAREEIAEDFWFVASAYGFTDADVEELIATRDW